MNIYMWSGPRNLSTALMRSFENREDTEVWDEPLYAYYLNETKKNHPMKDEIIKNYPTDINKIIKLMSNEPHNNKICYQKHMTHHILEQTPLHWIENGINCFLIRHPKEVIDSYIKKNNLSESSDIGFSGQYRIFQKVKKLNRELIVINANDIYKNPEKLLKLLCGKLNIKYSNKMIKWPLGSRSSDGCWHKVWYDTVKLSTSFEKKINKNINIPSEYLSIYNECLDIYNEINFFNLNNEYQ